MLLYPDPNLLLLAMTLVVTILEKPLGANDTYCYQTYVLQGREQFEQSQTLH